LETVPPIGFKFCMIVGMGSRQVFSPWGVRPRTPKIPNFDRECLENGKSQHYMSYGM